VAIGIYVLLGYVFLAFSRVLDVIAPGGLRLPLVLFIGMSLATLLAGRVFRFLNAGIGLWLFAFTLWVAISIPFSTWRGGSMEFFVSTLRSFVLAAAIIGLIIEMPQVFRLMRVIAYSILVGALLSFVYGQLSEGRLILAEGTFGDPNQYAMTLLFSFPFWLWIAKRLSFPAKLVPYACMVPLFVAFLRTGSRGAGIGFVAFCLVLFWQTPLIRKVPIAIFMVMVVIGGFALLPVYIQERYLTFFSADAAQATTDSQIEMREGADIGSSQARLTLLLNSIRMTVEHPLFGVGAGQFSYQLWQERKEQGLPTLFNETHNTYTQVSSELGVPALVIFVGILVSSIRSIRSVMRLKSSDRYRVPPEVLDTANTLLLALVVLCVCGFFLSLIWGPLFFVMPAIIAAFHRSVQDALPGWVIAPVATPPVLAVPRRVPIGRVPAPARQGLGRSIPLRH
jgi:O-antigen ligase